MSLHWKDATLTDTHDVLSDLSEISAMDFLLEDQNWWTALKTIDVLTTIPNGRMVVLIDEPLSYPLAIFGHYPGEQTYNRTTWFMTSKRFAQKGAAVTIACRKYLKTLQNLYPGVIFTSHTRSNHPEVMRWFKLLGFRYIGWTSDAARIFTLLPAEARKRDLVKLG